MKLTIDSAAVKIDRQPAKIVDKTTLSKLLHSADCIQGFGLDSSFPPEKSRCIRTMAIIAGMSIYDLAELESEPNPLRRVELIAKLADTLPVLSLLEHQAWCLTQKINARGFALDDQRIHDRFIFYGYHWGGWTERNYHIVNPAQLTAAPGHELFAITFPELEGRILACLANDKSLLRIYQSQGDPTPMLAAKLLGKALSSLTSDDFKLAQITEKSCRYQGGLDIFQRNAESQNLTIPENMVKCLIRSWRSKHPQIVNFWQNLEQICFTAFQNPGQKYQLHGLEFRCDQKSLQVTLPSGRILQYFSPELDVAISSETRPLLCGVVNSATQTMRRGLYGGVLAYDIVHATARDLILSQMLLMEESIVRIEPQGFVIEQKKSENNLENLTQLLHPCPLWASPIPVKFQIERKT